MLKRSCCSGLGSFTAGGSPPDAPSSATGPAGDELTRSLQSGGPFFVPGAGCRRVICSVVLKTGSIEAELPPYWSLGQFWVVCKGLLGSREAQCRGVWADPLSRRLIGAAIG